MDSFSNSIDFFRYHSSTDARSAAPQMYSFIKHSLTTVLYAIWHYLYFGSIWAVGLHVCPPVRLLGLLVPARLVSHAPCHPLSLRRRPQLVCTRRPTVRPSKPRPCSRIASPILIHRLLAIALSHNIL